MIALFRILSMLPLGLMHAAGGLLGWLVFALSGVYRRRFLANARQAGMARAQWLGAIGQAGKLVAELPRLWLGKPVAVQWSGAEHIDAALALGRGVVFLTPHLGCFEVTAQAYASRYASHFASRHGQTQAPMTVLFRLPRQPWLRELVATARTRPGLRTAPTTLSGVKQMIKALRQGQSVGLLPDQVPPLGMGLWAPFFGQDAYTMTLSARLVQQTGAAVLVAWGERLAGGQGFRVHVKPLQTTANAEFPADAKDAACLINRAMEDLIRQCPQQYLWGYARYKQPRTDA